MKALRQFAKTSKATQPFVGFGNPLLVGPSGADRSAWRRQSCAKRTRTHAYRKPRRAHPYRAVLSRQLADAEFHPPPAAAARDHR